jgi:hypothetical protein
VELIFDEMKRKGDIGWRAGRYYAEAVQRERKGRRNLILKIYWHRKIDPQTAENRASFQS